MWPVVVVWGLFGLIIGSFLNVIIIRRGARDVRGRSSCLSCGTTLRWYELIPVLSFLLQRGRCRTCGSHISLQYPLVEILTALSFAGSFASPQSIIVQIGGALLLSLLIMIAVYDIRHTIIPDEWVYAAMVVALFLGFAMYDSFVESALHALLGVGVALPLLLLWYISGGKWMGFGDVKLALVIGLALGPLGLIAVFLGFVIGACVGVLVLLPMKHISACASRIGITTLRRVSQSFTMKSEVPFGPFLIIGFCIVWFLTLYSIPLPLWTL